jgi:hypothetical protein
MCVLVIRTWRWLGAPPRLPFFLELGALGARVSALVTCRPSSAVQVKKGRWEEEKGIELPDESCFRRSTSFGTLSECHNSLNSRIRKVSETLRYLAPLPLALH